MKKPFSDFDLNLFWKDSDYAREAYISPTPSDKLIKSIEDELGYKFPSSYVHFMKHQNGGIPIDTAFPTKTPTSWAENHVAISGFLSIGREKSYSLCGDLGSQFQIEEWGYPPIGVYICNCPSAGHDMIMLDYSKCGLNGEPEVVHVDQDNNYKITFLASNFEEFVKGLVNADVYDTSEEDLKQDLKMIKEGTFSKLLKKLANQEEINIDPIIRTICEKLTLKKGYFAFHKDDLSYLMYDIQFWLYSKHKKFKSIEDFLSEYPQMIALSGKFSTGGYAPGFVEEWLDLRIEEGVVEKNLKQEIIFTQEKIEELVNSLKEYE